MTDDGLRRAWAEGIPLVARGCREVGSPFYGALLDRMADDVARAGPSWQVLRAYADAPPGDVVPIRLLGGVHRLVLAGEVPALAAHFPSTGGDGDADRAWPFLRDLLAVPPPVVLDALTRPPQTNEVGRSAALAPGMLEVAGRTAMPLRIRELGSSAGLNLRLDRYRFEHGGQGWGDPASPVRFDDFEGPVPLDVDATIVDRRGCDRDPLDATDPEARAWLLAYVWPEQHERFELLRAALQLAATVPVTIDRAEIPDWIEHELSAPVPGVATVVFHSIVWQYLSVGDQARTEAAITAAGARADDHAPLAWLRLEPSADLARTELRLTCWPGGGTEVLATAGYHVATVHWHATASPPTVLT